MCSCNHDSVIAIISTGSPLQVLGNGEFAWLEREKLDGGGGGKLQEKDLSDQFE